jgi:hypothetical protein
VCEVTQGSSLLATLGFVAESRWDSSSHTGFTSSEGAAMTWQADALQTLRVVEAGRRPAYTFVKMTIIVNVVDVLNVHCIPNKL